MKEWVLPSLGTVVLWGLWGFIPKITTRYIDPKSAIVYEVLGGILLAAIALFVFRVEVDLNPKGAALAVATGTLGFTGAYLFLTAVSKGPVILVSTVSALYPVVSIFLAASILHETVSLQQGVGIALAILAVILIAA